MFCENLMSDVSCVSINETVCVSVYIRVFAVTVERLSGDLNKYKAHFDTWSPI